MPNDEGFFGEAPRKKRGRPPKAEKAKRLPVVEPPPPAPPPPTPVMPRGVECRRCGCCHFYVVYVRPLARGRIRRRRQCRHCGWRVTTTEQAGA